MDILAARKKAAERAKAAREAQMAADDILRTAEGPVAPGSRGDPAGESSAFEEELRQELAPLPQAPVDMVPAAQLSSVPAPLPEQDLEMLAFLLGTEQYVIPVEAVREVLTPREITPVPHTVDHLLGVCSLRGTVLPVVDLAKRLALAEGIMDEKARIIVINLGEDDSVGLLVGRVQGVVRFPGSLVQPVPETVEKGASFLKGIARKDEQLYILLDVEKAVGLAHEGA